VAILTVYFYFKFCFRTVISTAVSRGFRSLGSWACGECRRTLNRNNSTLSLEFLANCCRVQLNFGLISFLKSRLRQNSKTKIRSKNILRASLCIIKLYYPALCDNGLRNGRSRSSKVIDFGTNRKRVRNFP